MFIINYEDITDAPNRVIPLPDIPALRNSKTTPNSNYTKRTCLYLLTDPLITSLVSFADAQDQIIFIGCCIG